MDVIFTAIFPWRRHWILDSRTIATLFQGRREGFNGIVNNANAESLREMLTPRGLKKC